MVRFLFIPLVCLIMLVTCQVTYLSLTSLSWKCPKTRYLATPIRPIAVSETASRDVTMAVQVWDTLRVCGFLAVFRRKFVKQLTVSIYYALLLCRSSLREFETRSSFLPLEDWSNRTHRYSAGPAARDRMSIYRRHIDIWKCFKKHAVIFSKRVKRNENLVRAIESRTCFWAKRLKSDDSSSPSGVQAAFQDE
jgi:hypothetical protein